MEIVIPENLLKVLIIVSCVMVYSIVGAIVGGIAYRYQKNIGRCRDTQEAFGIIFAMLWPVCLFVFLIWWTVFLPARFIFSKITGE